jgi:hypothetical protein
LARFLESEINHPTTQPDALVLPVLQSLLDNDSASLFYSLSLSSRTQYGPLWHSQCLDQRHSDLDRNRIASAKNPGMNLTPFISRAFPVPRRYLD